MMVFSSSLHPFLYPCVPEGQKDPSHLVGIQQQLRMKRMKEKQSQRLEKHQTVGFPDVQ